MQKLKLESLQVETFETSRLEGATRGTERAHDWSQFDPTCRGMSCDYACVTVYDNTCRASPCTT